MWNTYCTSLAVAVEVNPGQCIVKYFVKYRHSQFREREDKERGVVLVLNSDAVMNTCSWVF